MGLRRNQYYNDYKKAFGVEPPEIATIAIMSDSDNTNENVVSFIREIKIFY